MTKFMPFYYDERGFYQNDKSFIPNRSLENDKKLFLMTDLGL